MRAAIMPERMGVMVLWRLIKTAALLVVAAVLAATAFLFVWPRQDSPTRADAVVVLSGGRSDRLPEALQLMRRRLAPVLIISDGRAPDWPEANRLCDGRGPFRVICFRPDPYSTRGEAERVTRLARRYGWRSVIVVTSTYHVVRARMLFKRCYGGRVEAVGARPELLRFAQNVIQEWPKLIYELTLVRGC